MIPPHRLLGEVIATIKNVIAPAIPDPYPKTQAYMAAVILEMVARSLEERRDLGDAKTDAVERLVAELRGLGVAPPPFAEGDDAEHRVGRISVALDADRASLGEETYRAAKGHLRRAMRVLLDQDLRVAKGGE